VWCHAIIGIVVSPSSPSLRIWRELWLVITNMIMLGTGTGRSIFCHCNEGYHRGPTLAALVWCSIANSQLRDRSKRHNVWGVLLELSTVAGRIICSTLTDPDLLPHRREALAPGNRREATLLATAEWARQTALSVPFAEDYLEALDDLRHPAGSQTKRKADSSGGQSSKPAGSQTGKQVTLLPAKTKAKAKPAVGAADADTDNKPKDSDAVAADAKAPLARAAVAADSERAEDTQELVSIRITKKFLASSGLNRESDVNKDGHNIVHLAVEARWW